MSDSLLIELSVDDVAFGGSGVGRVDGQACFVPGTLEGEKVRAAIRSKRKKWIRADLLEVLEASPQRVDPKCPYFGRCGGCAYQHANYEEQLRIKSKQVEQTLRRLGGFETVPMRPMIPSPKPYGYRNRITVHRMGILAGFYDRGGRNLVDIKRCEIASEKVNAMLTRLRQTRTGDGNFTLSEPLATGGFRQTNAAAAELMLECVGSLLPVSGRLLVDAYCGSGFFMKRFLDRFEKAIGIEWHEAAVHSARKGQSAKEEYFHGDVSVLLEKALLGGEPEETVVIFDPPATGLDKEVVRVAREAGPDQMIYVSCDPSTLARDLQKLSPAYELGVVIPLDMFPQTAEIEVITSLRRRSG